MYVCMYVCMHVLEYSTKNLAVCIATMLTHQWRSCNANSETYNVAVGPHTSITGSTLPVGPDVVSQERQSRESGSVRLSTELAHRC